MSKKSGFDTSTFLPYLLNQAADRLSSDFSPAYRQRYGMLRTEWRVLFHLGQYGAMTAKQICDMAQLHKTKASRAVAALEAKRFVTRREVAHDRRHAMLNLTKAGRDAYQNLQKAAEEFDNGVQAQLSPEDAAALKRCLIQLAAIPNVS